MYFFIDNLEFFAIFLVFFKVNTQILLYTRRNRKVPDIISYSNISGTLPLTKFNISAPLKVIIHGFGSSCQRVWPSEMRLALLTVVGKHLTFIEIGSHFSKNTMHVFQFCLQYGTSSKFHTKCRVPICYSFLVHYSMVKIFPAVRNTMKMVKLFFFRSAH